ncbi:MAG: acylphosphatase, partial [Pedobacter sp.]|nr:acylphosphatase [Pedobacter sp.]
MERARAKLGMFDADINDGRLEIGKRASQRIRDDGTADKNNINRKKQISLMKHIVIRITGKVQGVSFRYTTKVVADQMGVR